MVALFILLFRLLKLSGQPIVVRIASVGEVLPLVGPLSFCLFADFHPFQLFGIGEVDIEAGQRRQAFFQNLAGNLADILSRRLKIGVRHVVAQ